jgi:ribosome maturation protein SDO1
VSIIRYSLSNTRFELAAYPSKVINYRVGVETDLSEVLQSRDVFTNVSKGELASSSDLQSAFGTTDSDVICEIILKKGQLQSSNLEREHTQTSLTNQLVEMLSTRCTNSDTGRVYTTGILTSMLKESGYNVNTTKDVKVVFLDAVRYLQDKGYRIERARMRVRIHTQRKHQQFDAESDAKSDEGLRHEGLPVQRIASIENVIVEKQLGEEEMVITIPPNVYQAIGALCKECKLTVEVVKLAVVDDEEREVGDGDGLESAMAKVSVSSASGANDGAKMPPPPPSQEQQKPAAASAPAAPLAAAQNEDSDSEEEIDPNMSTKDRKKAARKSKKTARRQKEKDDELKAKIEKEQLRRKEREERLANVNGGAAQDNSAPAAAAAAAAATTTTTAATPSAQGDKKPCNTCGGLFTPTQYRAHFKSDWHRYNLKLKSMGAATVGEDEFKAVDSDALFIE